jgi:sulfate transport system ATP-binding protein
MSIEVRGISKSFGGFTALRDVSLTVATGELVALLGPSGSGKTSLLRIIAGLEQPEPGSGFVRFDDEDVAGRRVGDRRVGFVFQHYALFRHMTVYENVAFGLRVRPRRERLPPAGIRERVDRLLQLVQLDWMADRYPSQLSGGQRQRVALARALAIEPRVLLLDEPFGSLDAKVRQGLRRWLRRLHDEIHVTSVFVTHDQEEALEVADRVVVMNQGRVEQVGTPEEVFHHPATPFVIDFLGNVNTFRGRIEAGGARFGSLVLDHVEGTQADGTPASLFVRPHALSLERSPNGHASLRATVRRVHSAGSQVKVELTADTGETLLAEMSHTQYADLPVTAGSTVYVTLREARVFVDRVEREDGSA